MSKRNSGSTLLTLIHLSDSALPIGGFAHSWGLETWCENGALSSSSSVFTAVSDLLRLSIAPQDGRACALAHRFANNDDLSAMAKLNAYLTASRWSAEPRQGSLNLGARFLKLALAGSIVPDLNGLHLDNMHHCAAFGWVCGRAGITAADAVGAYLYTCCAAMVSAAVRLIPLGQTDGQIVQAGLRPEIDALIDLCLEGEIEDLASFAPLHEQACVEHQTLYSRLFQS